MLSRLDCLASAIHFSRGSLAEPLNILLLLLAEPVRLMDPLDVSVRIGMSAGRAQSSSDSLSRSTASLDTCSNMYTCTSTGVYVL